MSKFNPDHCHVWPGDMDAAWAVCMERRLELYGFQKLVTKVRISEPCKVPRFGRRSRRGR